MPAAQRGRASTTVYPGDQWHYIVSRIVITARARGLQAIDGPYSAIRISTASATSPSARCGSAATASGRCTRPRSTILNEIYRPSQAQFDRAEALLSAYRQATEVDRRGAVMWEGEMIDEASRKMAEQVAARGRAAGMTSA